MPDQLDLFGKKIVEPEPEPEVDWLDPPREDSAEELQSQPLPTWADDEWFNLEGPTAPQPKPPKANKQKPASIWTPRERVIRPTRCAICGVEDIHAKPLIPWMGGLVHVKCHNEFMAERTRERNELADDSGGSGGSGRGSGQALDSGCDGGGGPELDQGAVERIRCQGVADGQRREAVLPDVGGPGERADSCGGEGEGLRESSSSGLSPTVCVICGSSEGSDKIYAMSKGVCHRRCFEEWYAKRVEEGW